MQKGKKRKNFEKLTIWYSKIIIFWWKTYEKNFFYYFLELTQNHAQSCRRLKKGKVLKNFQSHIVNCHFLMKNLWKINFFHHFLELTLNHAQSCRRVNKLNIWEKIPILYSKIIIFRWKTYEKSTFFIIFNLAKTSYERTDWHRDLKFGMWHQSTT